ncbi:hypothetical protein D6764_04520 [Candidatus Woesearchaeota archaeon]|nr:MAG: hypothetical protein D6764_04520 [Candidatus Woesearchaeota archaeon]
MIKSLLGKISKKDENVSPEILELRKKFAELDSIGKEKQETSPQQDASPQGENSPGSSAPSQGVQNTPAQNAPPNPGPPDQGTQQSPDASQQAGQPAGSQQNALQQSPQGAGTPEQTVVNVKHTVPTKKEVKIKLIDAEQAEQDERMTNLIMEQIKELIEIDDNLNTKIKDLNSQLAELKNEIEKTQKENKKAMDRMNIIESNMEKFMALYEVVTNQYNPFVSKNENGNQQQPQTVQTQPSEAVKGTAEEPSDRKTPDVPEKDAPQTAPDSSPVPQGTARDAAPETTPVPEQGGSGNVLHDSGSEAPKDQTEKESPSSPPVIVDKIDQTASLADVIETRINNLLADFKANFRKELHMDIDQKIKEMVQTIEQSLNQQLSSVVKAHIEDELREKLGKILSQESVPAESQPTPPTDAEPAVQGSDSADSQPKPVVDNTASASSTQNVHQEVHPDNYFWLPDGRPVKSLPELLEELSSMDDATFRQHVSEGKNDFAEWVRHVIGNEALASKIASLSTKQDITEAVREAVTGGKA